MTNPRQYKGFIVAALPGITLNTGAVRIEVMAIDATPKTEVKATGIDGGVGHVSSQLRGWGLRISAFSSEE